MLMSSRSPIAGIAVVLTAASLFGANGPLSRLAYEAGIEPLGFVAWRALVGLAAALAFVGWRVSRGHRRIVRLRDLDGRARLSLAIVSVTAFTLNMAMFTSFSRITVGLALLGFYTYPVMVAVVDVILGHERLDRPRIVALVIAVGGMMAVLIGQLDPTAGIRFDVVGFGFALAAASSQAVFVVLSRNGYRAVPADQAIAVVMAVAVVLCGAMAIATGAVGALTFPIHKPALLPILVFSGLFAAAIPSILFLTGIRILGGMRAGILMLFEPVVGVALAGWLLSERLAPIQVAGGLAILSAALILQRSASTEARILSAPAVEAQALGS
jgi:drug/metabolite transporter (DMT)-like permease